MGFKMKASELIDYIADQINEALPAESVDRFKDHLAAQVSFAAEQDQRDVAELLLHSLER